MELSEMQVRAAELEQQISASIYACFSVRM